MIVFAVRTSKLTSMGIGKIFYYKEFVTVIIVVEKLLLVTAKYLHSLLIASLSHVRGMYVLKFANCCNNIIFCGITIIQIKSFFFSFILRTHFLLIY